MPSLYSEEEQKEWIVSRKTCAGCAFLGCFGNGTLFCDFDNLMSISRPSVMISGRMFPEYPKDCTVRMTKKQMDTALRLGISEREAFVKDIRERSGRPLKVTVHVPRGCKIDKPPKPERVHLSEEGRRKKQNEYSIAYYYAHKEHVLAMQKERKRKIKTGEHIPKHRHGNNIDPFKILGRAHEPEPYYYEILKARAQLGKPEDIERLEQFRAKKNQYAKEWYRRNREKAMAYSMRYQKEHWEEIKAKRIMKKEAKKHDSEHSDSNSRRAGSLRQQ